MNYKNLKSVLGWHFGLVYQDDERVIVKTGPGQNIASAGFELATQRSKLGVLTARPRGGLLF